MPDVTDTAAGYCLWRWLWVILQALLDLPGWSGRSMTGSSAVELFCLKGFKLCEYWSIWNYIVKPEAAHLGGFSENCSFVWQWAFFFFVLHLLPDLDLHQQSQKPQRRKISEWITCCLTEYNFQLHFWVFQDPWPLVYTFVWAPKHYFPHWWQEYSLTPRFSCLVPEVVRKQCL